MKPVSFLLTIVASLCLSTGAWGQQTLSNGEIQKILQQVTSQPRKTWISVGTIAATHQEYGAAKVTDTATIQSEVNKAVQQYQGSSSKIEKTPELQKMKLDAIPFNVRYKLANEWAMSSHVIVKYDNGRFYWDISVDSRQDSVKPDATLAGNYMTKQFTMSWNQRRIFAWDGQEYTTYSVSGGHANVDAAGKLQRAVDRAADGRTDSVGIRPVHQDQSQRGQDLRKGQCQWHGRHDDRTHRRHFDEPDSRFRQELRRDQGHTHER